jgi:hypothetical protein
MSQVKTSLIVELNGNVTQRAAQFANSIQRLGLNGSRSMQMLERSVTTVRTGLDKLGNRYTAMLSGLGGMGAMKTMGDLSERLAYMGAGFRASRKEIDALYQSLLKTAQDKDIRVNPEEILAGVESIKQKFGEIKFAEDNLRNIGLIIRATGAAGKDVGDILANLKEKFKIETPQELLQAMDVFAVQGKAGAFELRDMVTQGNEVTAAYSAMGRTGVPAVREMGAALQVMRRSSGSAAETATAFENIMAELTDKKNVKLFKKVGIQIYAKGHEKDHKMLAPFQEISDQILKVTGGDPEKVGRIFGLRAKHGFNAFTTEYLKTGKNPIYEFLDKGGDGKEILKDAAEVAKEFNASMESLRANWQRFASSNVLPKVQKMADFLNSLQPATVDRWMKIGGAVAGVMGALVVGNKVVGAGAGLIRLFGGGKSAAAAAAGLAGGAVPVRVVNLPGLQGTGAGAVAGRTLLTTGLGAAALPLGTAVIARPLAKYLADEQLKASSTARLKQLLNNHMVMGGGAQSYQAQVIASELQKRGAFDGNIKLVIDQEGRAKVTELKQGSNLKINVDNGVMMVSH